MLAYPKSLPLDAIQLATEIVKDRAIQARKVEFAQAAWNIQGFVLEKTLGTPTLPGCPVDGSDCDCDDETYQKLLDLEAVMFEMESEPQMFGAEDEQEAASVVTIIAIVSGILQLISFLRNRKDPDPSPEA